MDFKLVENNQYWCKVRGAAVIGQHHFFLGFPRLIATDHYNSYRNRPVKLSIVIEQVIDGDISTK